MKINEIVSNQVNEGFWDALKAAGSGVAAAATGKNPAQAASQTYQQSVGEKNLAGMTKSVMARWNQQIAPAIPPAKKTDPATIKQYLDKFLSSYFAGDYSSNNALDSADAQAVGNYIRKAVNAEAAGMSVASTSQQPQQPPDTTAAQPPQSTVQGVRPGYRIKVTNPSNGGIYYKTTAGWFNDVGQQLKKQQSIDFLDQLANNIGKEEPDPGQQHPPPPPQGQQQQPPQQQAQPSNKRRRKSRNRAAP
jgi:hypothetical protein